MKIVHNIALSVTQPEQQDFHKLGIELHDEFASFQIEEGDFRWPEVKLLVDKYHAVDSVRTTFSQTEYKQAEYLGLMASWHYGYPMPDDDFGYLQSFDRSEYCKRCGIGLKQIAPFRIKESPPWGRKSIVQLNWIFDEFLVTPESWSTVFKPYDIQYRPVLLHRDGSKLDSIVQLRIDRLIELDVRDLPYEDCASCGRKKYLPITRGFWPQPSTHHGLALFKSEQYFGSGASAYRLVVASRNLYRSVVDSKLKGVTFAPCAFPNLKESGSETKWSFPFCLS